MNCNLCKFSIYEGMEVFFQKEAYHPDCAVKAQKLEDTKLKVNKVTKALKLRVLSGGKK